jgi:hypothetical protein
MMRALLFLCLTGAAIYGFLVFTQNALKDADPKGGVAIQTEQSRSAGEPLSSWDSHLPSQLLCLLNPLPQKIVRVRQKAMA